MIVRGADGSKRELYAAFDSSTPIPRHSQWGGGVASSGERVDFGSAVSLPAFLRGVRLISETAAGLPWTVYRGYGSRRRPVERAPQLAILRRPNPDTNPFAAWSYTYMSLLRGNAYLWKVKVRGRLKYLYPLNPACVTPKYEGSTTVFEVRETPYGPVRHEVGRDTVIHIPGILLEDPCVGVSVVQAHRHELGNDLGRRRFEGRYIANDAAPGVLLRHTGMIAPSEPQRQEIRGSFEARHGGQGNAGRVGMVWGGWEVDRVPVSLQDAQFIESKRFSVQDIGRMLGVPSGFLNDPDAPGSDSPEQENMRLLQHGVGPWMTRVEQGLSCDTDLFPDADVTLESDEQGFLRADIQTRWDAYRLGRQGGWVTANEIRAREGLPPVKDGDTIQVTPVGGAANPATSASGKQAGDGPEQASRAVPEFSADFDPHQPRDEDGQWTDTVGNVMRLATAADRRKLRIPPAWTDVRVAADGHEDQPLQAIGLDAKRRVQRVYSPEHARRQAALKFERIHELDELIDQIDHELSRDESEEAAALRLIRRTGMRPGSDADTGADKDAYGATNLRVKHVTVAPDEQSVRLQFTGKKGVDLDFTFDDPDLAKMFAGRLGGKSEDDKVFDTDAVKVRARFKQLAPGHKVKDLRTYRGSRLAFELVEREPVPRTAKERTAARNRVGDAVAAVLGNTRSVALNSYIDPAVFSGWDNPETVESKG